MKCMVKLVMKQKFFKSYCPLMWPSFIHTLSIARGSLPMRRWNVPNPSHFYRTFLPFTALSSMDSPCMVIHIVQKSHSPTHSLQFTPCTPFVLIIFITQIMMKLKWSRTLSSPRILKQLPFPPFCSFFLLLTCSQAATTLYTFCIYCWSFFSTLPVPSLVQCIRPFVLSSCSSCNSLYHFPHHVSNTCSSWKIFITFPCHSALI